MNFRKATDTLFMPIAHADLAKTLGVSIPAIRQARLAPRAKAHRSPPDGWERAIVQMAEQRISRYRQLIEHLTNEAFLT